MMFDGSGGGGNAVGKELLDRVVGEDVFSLFLGTFVKFRKVTISFVMSIHPSVRVSA
jgi:hypothetical protein